MTDLNLSILQEEAGTFSEQFSTSSHPNLYGVTDGKAVGTYLEHAFKEHLQKKYSFTSGSSAKGIDLPSLNVDIKVTSIKQPQSSCPYRSARQKVYGLGYHIILFVYEKIDTPPDNCVVNVLHTVFIDKSKTADFTLTTLLNKTLELGGNEEDIISDLASKNLPIDDIEASTLAKDIMNKPPEIGYLTISNALQWRLQYKRVVDKAGTISGISNLKKKDS